MLHLIGQTDTSLQGAQGVVAPAHPGDGVVFLAPAQPMSLCLLFTHLVNITTKSHAGAASKGAQSLKTLRSVETFSFSGDPGLQWYLVAAMLFTSLPDVTVWRG